MGQRGPTLKLPPMAASMRHVCMYVCMYMYVLCLCFVFFPRSGGDAPLINAADHPSVFALQPVGLNHALVFNTRTASLQFLLGQSYVFRCSLIGAEMEPVNTQAISVTTIQCECQSKISVRFLNNWSPLFSYIRIQSCKTIYACCVA